MELYSIDITHTRQPNTSRLVDKYNNENIINFANPVSKLAIPTIASKNITSNLITARAINNYDSAGTLYFRHTITSSLTIIWHGFIEGNTGDKPAMLGDNSSSIGSELCGLQGLGSSLKVIIHSDQWAGYTVLFNNVISTLDLTKPTTIVVTWNRYTNTYGSIFTNGRFITNGSSQQIVDISTITNGGNVGDLAGMSYSTSQITKANTGLTGLLYKDIGYFEALNISANPWSLFRPAKRLLYQPMTFGPSLIAYVDQITSSTARPYVQVTW